MIYLVSFVLVFALAGSATANKQWTGDGGDNYWSNPANWSGDGGFYIVDLDNATVLIDSGDQTAENGTRIGDYGSNITLNITGGSLTSGQTRLGYNPGASCTVNISGDGSFVNTTYIRMAYDEGSACTINLTDNATADVDTYVRIGTKGAGNGIVNITDNASMNLGGYFRSAYYEGSRSLVTISSNGKLNVGDYYRVANRGDGVLTVKDNGAVDIANALYVPYANGTGTVNLQGGTIHAGELVIEKEDGIGLVDIWDGSLLLDDDVAASVNAHIDAGKIGAFGLRAGEPGFGTTANVEVNYDSGANLTTLTAYTLLAYNPSPHKGQEVVAEQITLSWSAGRGAASHDVYFGTSFEDVNNGTGGTFISSQPLAETSYGPIDCEIGQIYYWKVNEVNMAETTTLEGDVWSFTIPEYLVVDDFESYNDLDSTDPESNRIFLTWADGYKQPANGSIVGYAVAPFTEQTIVHSGTQSMPLSYDNTGVATYSEAERTFAVAQDWIEAGVLQMLVLYFHGAAGNTGQLYVKLNDSKVVYDGSADDIKQALWQQWPIDLASLGAGLQNVTKLGIGIDGNGAGGTLYVDDIRLYRLAP